jgi:lactate dehydrogenase-like 2-hydroxyacid dehydrogenase
MEWACLTHDAARLPTYHHTPPTPNPQKVRLIALRSAGCNHVDMEHIVASKYESLSVVHVPAYSPHAVAEHALALLMTLNRRTHKVYVYMYIYII